MWRLTNDRQMPKDIPLNTKIDTDAGIRNEQKLIWDGNLWWHTDKKMYVYYTPTHWSY